MRDIIMEYLYEGSKLPYQRFIKKSVPWTVSASELITYPNTSLGFHLGCFLLKYRFELQPKLENHDVFHVLTETGISVPEEIGMQYYLLGNGKRSIYGYAVILLGTLLYPDYIRYFSSTFKKGKKALPFHQLDFSKLLQQSISRFKTTFLIH